MLSAQGLWLMLFLASLHRAGLYGSAPLSALLHPLGPLLHHFRRPAPAPRVFGSDSVFAFSTAASDTSLGAAGRAPSLRLLRSEDTAPVDAEWGAARRGAEGGGGEGGGAELGGEQGAGWGDSQRDATAEIDDNDPRGNRALRDEVYSNIVIFINRALRNEVRLGEEQP